MNLTDEQLNILSSFHSVNDIIVINAFAGTGKTTTLVEYAKQNLKGNKVLYLAFNRSLKLEADRKFPEYVTCNTTHQLCFKQFGLPLKHKLLDSGCIYSKYVYDYLTDKVKKRPDVWYLISLALNTVNNFVASRDYKIKNKHIPQLFNLLANIIKCIDFDKRYVLTLARYIWHLMIDKDSEMPIVHDTYLKLFQLSKPKLNYDYLLLDEIQDFHDATLDIIAKQVKRSCILFVGDKYQQMYEFRGSVNAFDKIDYDYKYCLTNSFRFGKSVARLATNVLQKYFKEKNIIKGLGYDTEIKIIPNSQMEQYLKMDRILIARTNGRLCLEAIDALENNKTFGFLGGFNKEVLYILQSIIDLKNKNKPKHRFIGLFKSYEELKEYVRQSNEQTLQSYLDIVNDKGYSIVNMMHTVLKRQANFNDAQVKLLTTHKAKGLQFDNIIIADDFLNINNLDGVNMEEEARVFYVAITRCIRRLYIFESFYNYLLELGLV